MPDMFTFEVESYTATKLDIKVKNTSGEALEKALVIQLKPPKALMGDAVKTAADAARGEPQSRKKLTGIVTSPPALSVWATPGETNDSLGIMFKNDLNDAGTKVSPNKIEAGAEFTISIPLDSTAARAAVIIFPYACKHGTGAILNGTVELKSQPDQWVPNVTLKTNQDNPTAIEPPGLEIKILWNIENAVSATLRGPGPGGNVALELGTKAFPFRDGELLIRAVGPVTYLLQADVKNPATNQSVQITKVLMLDIKGSKQYGHIKASPERVLPFGPVKINWAAWGISKVIIDIGGATTNVELTEMSLTGHYQGKGVLDITAGRGGPIESAETKAYLTVAQGPAFETAQVTGFRVISWRTMKNSSFKGTPISMAVAGSVIGLLTTQGLWTANVGTNDFNPINYDLDPELTFTQKVTDAPKAWLGLAAFGDKFAVLRQTNQNDLQMVLYTAAGAVDGVPVDLPGDWRSLVSRGGAVFDVAAYGGRVYVVAENQQRRACSVVFQGETKTREELALESLAGYRLLTFDGVLYALNRDSGNMFRFTLTADGKLEPRKAASAVTQVSGRQTSMVKQGMFVPVGNVMAVLSPSALPSLASLAAFSVQNVLKYETPQMLRDAVISQDLVYNPQQDLWSRCGHGLDLEPGMISCFRYGDSKRLWVIEPKGKTYTLTVSTEHLFAHNYDLDLVSKPLPVFLNKNIECKILNNTNLQFVPLDDTCFKAGVTPFSSTSLVEMNPYSINLTAGVENRFAIRYGSLDPPSSITLRFMVQPPAGVNNRDFLELTLSGTDLSTATTIFKRINVNAQGSTSIAELSETRQQHATNAQIQILPPGLVMKLTFRNTTPYQLWLRSPEAPDQSARAYNGEEISINYSVPPFSIYAHGAGDLVFEIDISKPHGMEVKQPNTNQTQRIRVDQSKAQALRLHLIAFRPAGAAANYEFAVSHRIETALPGVFIGDGVPAGENFYVPLGSARDANKSDVVRITANDLKLEKSISVDSSGIFSHPNSIAVLSDKVVGIFQGTAAVALSPDLTLLGGHGFFWHDIITTLKGAGTKLWMLGIKVEPGNQLKCSIVDLDTSNSALNILSLDQQKGFRNAGITGAPAWLSPLTNSPMDVNGQTAAICVEGGLFLIDLNRKSVTEIKLEGTGREEAVLVDLRDNYVFCAHSTPNGQGLIVSYVSLQNQQTRANHTFFTPVHNMLTHTNPPTTPDLKYKSSRGVSLVAVQDQLVVSHGREIYVLNKRDLRVLREVTVDLPCRLIRAQLGTPPGESHPKYGAPREGFIVWAVGGTYEGNGQTRDKYQTAIYKIAIRR